MQDWKMKNQTLQWLENAGLENDRRTWELLF